MPENENTVVEQLPEVADDAQQENEGESLSTITDAPQEEEQPQKDAGWFRQRIDKAKAQAVAEYKAQHDSELEEIRAELAEYRAERLERQAKALVDKGDFGNIELAKEYLTFKQGGKPVQQEQPQVPDQIEQARMEGRNNELVSQAQKILNKYGVDVMAALKESKDLQVNVFKNGWDMHDVYEYLQNKRNPPSPARSSNGAKAEKTSISKMSDAQFRALQKKLSEGVKYNLRE